MLLVESLNKFYYCPPKSNRQVNGSNGSHPYTRVGGSQWSEHECRSGKTIKIRGFPKEHKVKLFRVAVSDKRTDWVVTNDLAQCSMQEAQEACALR